MINSLSQIQLILSVFLLSLMLPASLHAQKPETAGKTADKGQKLKVRFVALGHRRLAQFKNSQKEEVVKFTTPDGDVVEEIFPAGVPVEVMGKPFEYLPPLVYVRNRGKDKNYVTSPLMLNASTREIEISPRQRIDVLLRQRQEGSEGGFAFSNYVSSPVGENQSHLLLALINRVNELEGWKNPVVKAFDVSPKALPGGSLLVFNATPLKIEIDVPIKNKHETLTIDSLKSRIVPASVNENGRTLVRARLVSPTGEKKQFFYNSMRLEKNKRAYLFAYFDPRRQTSNPAGMVQFRDELPATEQE